ncbi:PREDICTED: protein phosphatase 2C 37 isoform X2 [Tarenaya hassleriana]|uniref:protein phosphatase 2C 37 isoform X1 n=1 Tax=Tarenaya hassleriana TaxID=28532 RepID=UPI00053C24F0|nr:PREDICTED: protein phosphatase 2C 37 isoform X1 [Tarenaya hassleriana]XP_010543771.1 PREDICTED: protein phosphatase 2C 37 isoform X2 [Tarenaya hassleriana]
MAGICCGVVGESESAAPVEPSSRGSRRRKLDLLPSIKIVAVSAVAPPLESFRKRQKCGTPSPAASSPSSSPSSKLDPESIEKSRDSGRLERSVSGTDRSKKSDLPPVTGFGVEVENGFVSDEPKFGMTSVCGRRRDMEDAVSIHPSFHRIHSDDLHFFGVFDGHGCSHVAEKCRERLHEIVKQELEVSTAEEWKGMMVKSFLRMDKEVSRKSANRFSGVDRSTISCRCDLQSPQYDAVGSTAAVSIVTPKKIIVSNCGDSRVVLCRNGVAIPLSSDHKPDRPDELLRIQQAGGRVIYWDGPRVLGVLAMSRAIGDSYLKPFVIPDPEVTVTDRTDEDECLIIASDGLWDVVPNETACGVARMCLRGASEEGHKACSDAALLLTKLALARQSADNVSVVVVDLRRNLSGSSSS